MFNSVLDITLVADGSSDRALVPIVEAVFDSACPEIPFRVSFAQGLPSGSLARRLRKAMEDFPCDVLLVHRDSEGRPVKDRELEIAAALKAEGISISTVRIIPVRMTESWLLVDEKAIRHASGNPSGSNHLSLPKGAKVEQGNAKNFLVKAIGVASELPQGRLNRLDLNRARQRVAELLDAELLVSVPSFRHFKSQVEALFASAT